MAYRIDLTQPVGDEVRRAFVEQVRKAAGLLAPPPSGPDGPASPGPSDAAVHDARKAIKKARSLLRLARADVGASMVGHLQAELRSLAGHLAPQREAEAAVEAARSLLHAASRPDPADLALVAAVHELVQRLEAEAARLRAGRAVSWPAVRTTARDLRAVADFFERWTPKAHGWDALEPGLRRQYERGRRAFEQLPDQPSVEELHEWRKRAKDLGYHERFLRPLWPEALKPIVDAASRLADELGADHDLGLLQAGLEPGDPVRSLVVEVRAGHEAEARRLGALLYADRPGAWVRRHHRWWETVVTSAQPVA